MEKKILGKTGLRVSQIGFGAGHLDKTYDELGFQAVDELLNTVLDLGINIIDTARSYGKSEELIGKVLSKKRDSFILSSKTGYGVEGLQDWQAETVIRAVESSLKILNTDHIDIMHLHSCDLSILEKGDVIEALERCKREGKIRFIAYSGENEALEYAVKTNRFDTIQTSDNLVDQHSRIYFSNTQKENHKLGIIGKRPLANFVWKYNSCPDRDDLRSYWLRLEEIKKIIGTASDLKIEELIYSYLKSHEVVDTHIIGTSSSIHLKNTIRLIEESILDSEKIKMICDFSENKKWPGLI